MKDKNILPIGSVVLIKNVDFPVLIVGQLPVYKSDDEYGYFDFSGTETPIGLNKNNVLFFNFEDIETILFVGYIDARFQEYLTKYDKIISEIGLKKLKNNYK